MDDALLGLVVVLLILAERLDEILFIWLFVGGGVWWLAAAEFALFMQRKDRR